MAEVSLQVNVRQHRGKKGAKQSRRAGVVPGIYYMRGQDSVAISVDEKALRRVLQSDAKIIDVSIVGGVQNKCVIREVQWDAVKGVPLHVDLMGVKLTEKVKVKVPVQVSGTAAGVKEGGILQVVLRELEIESLPLDLPEHITIEVAGLKINEAVHVRDIAVDKIKILADPDSVVLAVLPPRLEEVPVAAPVEEVAEPEVIGRARKEEEVEALAGQAQAGKEPKVEKRPEKEKK